MLPPLSHFKDEGLELCSDMLTVLVHNYTFLSYVYLQLILAAKFACPPGLHTRAYLFIIYTVQVDT